MTLKGSAGTSHMKCTPGSTRQYQSNPASSGCSKNRPEKYLLRIQGGGRVGMVAAMPTSAGARIPHGTRQLSARHARPLHARLHMKR